MTSDPLATTMQNRKQKSKKEILNKTAPVSPIFDTALPLSLRQPADFTKQHAPRVNIGAKVPLSPYVIRLSREEGAKTQNKEANQEAEIEALMRQLMNSDEDLEQETEDPEVLVDFLDLMNQVREDLPQNTCDLRTPIRHTAPWHSEGPVSPLPEQAAAPITISNILPEFTEESPIEIAEQVEEVHVELEEVPVSNHKTWSFTLSPLFTHVRYRMTATFIALSLLFVLPIQAMQEFSELPALGEDIISGGQAAAAQLEEGSVALLASDYAFAAEHFDTAASAFGTIQGQVREATKGIGLIASVIPQSSRAIRTTQALVTTGESLSTVARLFATAVADIDTRDALSPTQKIQLFETYLEKAKEPIAAASGAVQNIDLAMIPQEQQQTVGELLSIMPSLLQNITHLQQYLNATHTLLGGDDQKSYLLVFQNNAELRATGGFMGSFAEIKVDEGRVRNVFVPTGGTYDVQGQLETFVAPPEPLRLINPRWEFQDINWFPDFRMSAKKMLEFHEASGGPTMDGVIAINASVLPDLLAITGPILVDGKELNAENVLFELQRRDDVPEDAPKSLVASLTNALFTQLESADAKTLLAISDVIFTSLSEQEIQLYMKNSELAALVHNLHWSGAQLPYSFDALQVINTNIGGGKSDAVVDQHVDLQVDIEEDGTVTNTLTITKTHRGIASPAFQGINNVDYMRVYVPRGSELLSAEGFDERPPDHLFETTDVALALDKDIETTFLGYTQDESSLTDIWEENGFAVFGNWVQTKPGETEVVTLRYRLPESVIANDFSPDLLQRIRQRIGMKDISSYSLVLQKQSGAENRNTTVHVAYPPSWKKSWDNFSPNAITNNTNHVIQALFERPMYEKSSQTP